MATRPLRPCSNPRCGVLTKKTRCPKCATEYAAALDATRPTSTRRGYDSKWRRVRALVLRDQPLCACGAVATEVDHVVALAAGGTDALANLRALCKSCHSKKTVALDGALARRRGRGGGCPKLRTLYGDRRPTDAKPLAANRSGNDLGIALDGVS